MLDTVGIVVAGLYLLSLLVIGGIARRASREASLRDYYLAGGSLGAVSLFFTLYATQYSGNTLFGVPGQAYREGFSALSVVFAVMGIILVYTVFAPQLHQQARRLGFVTPGDFVRWRFENPALLVAVNLIFVITLTGYVLTNLKGIGLLVEGSTGGMVSSAHGILLLCLVMAIYESLGGMRSVVWTDVLQGSILLAGCIFIFQNAWRHPDIGITEFTSLLDSAQRTFSQSESGFEFVSLLLLVAIGAAVYPQAIQRIYAAKDVTTLRRSYTVMFVMPLLVMLPLTLIAMSAANWLPPLSFAESERVILHAIDFALADTFAGWAMLTLFVGAAAAAIMSTVDSALLALGAIISNDILRHGVEERDEAKLHRMSRLVTWVLMALMAGLAIVLPQSIWTLLVLKFELLVQVAPTIVLGVRAPGLNARSLLAGIIVGCTTALLLKASPDLQSPLGIHAGIWGLGANLVCVILVQRFSGSR